MFAFCHSIFVQAACDGGWMKEEAVHKHQMLSEEQKQQRQFIPVLTLMGARFPTATPTDKSPKPKMIVNRYITIIFSGHGTRQLHAPCGGDVATARAQVATRHALFRSQHAVCCLVRLLPQHTKTRQCCDRFRSKNGETKTDFH